MEIVIGGSSHQQCSIRTRFPFERENVKVKSCSKKKRKKMNGHICLYYIMNTRGHQYCSVYKKVSLGRCHKYQVEINERILSKTFDLTHPCKILIYSESR